MSALDSLPPDQRAVLTLVLQRGRSYDDIANLLSIDRAAVRDRALAALDALGPSTRVAALRRALITDYLLGQLPELVKEQTRASLASSASERAWARVAAGELASIAAKPLPEIPSSQATSTEPAKDQQTAASPAPAAQPETKPTAHPPSSERAKAPAAAADAGQHTPLGLPQPVLAPRPSSRRGGSILLGVGALIVVAVVIIVIATSGGSTPGKSTPKANTTPATTTTATTGTTGTTGTTSTNSPHIVAKLHLKPLTSSSKAAGIAEVVAEGKQTAVIIAADHMPPNSAHNAYAVWLYSPGGAARLLGYVSPGVGKSGILKTTGQLPTNAASYKEILIALQTTTSTTVPGPTVLQGLLGLTGGG